MRKQSTNKELNHSAPDKGGLAWWGRCGAKKSLKWFQQGYCHLAEVVPQGI